MEFFSRRRYEVLSVIIAVASCGLQWWSDTALDVEATTGPIGAILRGVHYLEGRATDLQFQLRGELAPSSDVVLVVVDEPSAQAYGLWPWKRSLTAAAIENLHKAGAKAIGMDMIFTDPDKAGSAGDFRSLLTSLDESMKGQSLPQLAGYRERLATLVTSGTSDADLARAFADAPEVVMGVTTYDETEKASYASRLTEETQILTPYALTEFPASSGIAGAKYAVTIDKIASWKRFSAQTPLPMFARYAKHLGHFDVPPDPDGTLRRVPLFAKLQKPPGLVPALALATAAVYFGATIEPAYNPDTERLDGARLRTENGRSILVPVELGEPYTRVNHLGKSTLFKQLSMADVVNGRFNPADVKGKAVLMGVTLIGLFDTRVTPFSSNEPGVYSQASFLSNILQQSFLTRPNGLRLAELVMMVLIALIVASVIPRVRFSYKLLIVFVCVAAWWLIAQRMFTHAQVLTATVLPTANVLLTAFGVIFLGYLSVDREKGVLRSAFQHYLNESVMEEMLKNPDKLKLGGEKKEMTVLFSDIRGFTTLSERMAPEALVKFINAYLTPMTRIVFEEGGTLDKYIGDALMAFWNAPLEQDDHALRACRASVRFLEKLKELKAAWRDQNLPEFDIGVGINSGPMIVGNMGSDIRFDYTVMGDAVNLASRLEGTNKEYETRVMISEATYLLASDGIVARRLGAVRVKGKRKPVRIYELRGLGKAEGAEAEAIAVFENALDLYTDGKFPEAEERFQKVLTLWPDDPPSRRYLEEVAVLKTRPLSPTWDGVYTATHK